MRNHLRMIVDAIPANVAVARLAVAAFAASADFTATDVEEIKVAVSEAVSNSVLHAYPDGGGEVLVDATLEEDALTVVVEDAGLGISDKEKAQEAGYSTLPDHMGLGFSFMGSFMDEFSLDSVPGEGTRVRMVKHRCKV